MNIFGTIVLNCKNQNITFTKLDLSPRSYFMWYDKFLYSAAATPAPLQKPGLLPYSQLTDFQPPTTRSFRDKEGTSGYDVFVTSRMMHYQLIEPLPAFSAHIEPFLTKMVALKWVADEIVHGDFGHEIRKEDPEALKTFLNDNTEMLVKVCQNWDFVHEMVSA